MSSDPLRAEVGEAIAGRWADVYTREVADAVIGVVLAVVADEVKALPRYNFVGEDWLAPDDVLAVVERLGERGVDA